MCGGCLIFVGFNNLKVCSHLYTHPHMHKKITAEQLNHTLKFMNHSYIISSLLSHIFLPTGPSHLLSRYSPLHNLPQPPYSGPPYPAILLLTADHDDRVVPLHTLKYCAALQHGVGSSPGQCQPLMVRVDTRSGHGAGKPTAKAILEDTHIFSFIAETLGLSWKD